MDGLDYLLPRRTPSTEAETDDGDDVEESGDQQEASASLLVDEDSVADGGVSPRVDEDRGSDEEASIVSLNGLKETTGEEEEEEHRSRSSGSSRGPSPQ